VFLRSLDK